MNPIAVQLERKAREAKSLYAAGEISYDELYQAASEYIDYCNTRAQAIAKEHGMKPKTISVKAWLR